MTSTARSSQEAFYSSYQTQAIAHWLTRRGRAEDAVSRSVASAKVDMIPHQVDAAVFALHSPLSQGVILADEVGLGKTIEAGLVLSQFFAERKRNILLIAPAVLRKQWLEELQTKFGLPGRILESKSFRDEVAKGNPNPFDGFEGVTLCSYQFASGRYREITAVPWDLVVMDEAHRLRNVYQKGAKIAKRLREALADRRKILLTATPFQNRLMELYGLVTLIDPEFFGSEDYFRSHYSSPQASSADLLILKDRLKSICRRTLRRQVQLAGEIKFTKRFSITEDFTPSDEEWVLYEKISAYLNREDIRAIKPGERHLVILVLRKILASSSFAIGETLGKMIDRLQKNALASREVLEDFDALDDLAEELEQEGDGASEAEATSVPAELQREIDELADYRRLAEAIRQNAKGEALVKVLDKAFKMTEDLGGKRKAVLFTESRRTQRYLQQLLSDHGYQGKIILLNGQNEDAASKAIYNAWKAKHKGSDLLSGSRTADMKAALVDAFKREGEILIATESGAEGINLQFCSLLINYDLPWNPQRVEQRIGRVHRYGQQNDVVVVNFVNRRNRADELIFELLDKKFKLFEGVFGASDTILGAIESGTDIETRIGDIFRQCRGDAEIEAEFQKLRQELDETLKLREADSERMLLEHADSDVVKRIRLAKDRTRARLDEIQERLLLLARGELPQARFEDRHFEWQGECHYLDWKEAEAHGCAFFQVETGLGEELIRRAKERPLGPAHLVFRYAAPLGQFSDLKAFIGKSGWMKVEVLSLESRQGLDHVVMAGESDAGETLDHKHCDRLLQLPCLDQIAIAPSDLPGLDTRIAQAREALIAKAAKENDAFFQAETEKLDRWAEEQRLGLQDEINAMDREIKERKKALRALPTLAEKTAAKRDIMELERKRDKKQAEYFQERERIAAREAELLDRVEASLAIEPVSRPLFTLRWELVE
jgi:ERCC4-related helicase